MRITKIEKNHGISLEKHENHEILGIQFENQENYENQMISCVNDKKKKTQNSMREL